MIPKVIHYCWFGGNPLPRLALRCLESWKRYCPDYEIKEWNEGNFDLASAPPYVQQAYGAKKWAFVTDYVRLWVIYYNGGIYMDTDVELLKPLDSFLVQTAFSGFESSGNIPTGIMAGQSKQPLFCELLEEYNDISFFNADGSCNITTNVKRITETCVKYGLVLNNSFQVIQGFSLFPCDYFCPKDSVTREIHLTSNTVAIHHFDGSWMARDRKLVNRVSELFGFRTTKVLIKIKHFMKRMIK